MAEYTFIGDIHSAADDLAVLLADTSITKTRLIFLGDYIDGTAGRHLGHLTQLVTPEIGQWKLVPFRSFA